MFQLVYNQSLSTILQSKIKLFIEIKKAIDNITNRTREYIRYRKV